MKLTRHENVADFERCALSFLTEREAENNLILGLCASQRETPAQYTEPPYLATVEDDGAVVAAAVRTPPQQLVVSACPAAAIERIARDALDTYGALPGVLGPSTTSRAFAGMWQGLTGRGPDKTMAERIYQLDAVVPVSDVPGRLDRATASDRDLLLNWIERFTIEAIGTADRSRIQRSLDARLGGGTAACYLWRAGDEPVSLAGCAGPTPNGIRIGPVYTPPGLRGRGYASACVAALSQLQLDSGRRCCFLFTNLANPTSNAIYQAIGYRPVCDVDHIVFQS